MGGTSADAVCGVSLAGPSPPTLGEAKSEEIATVRLAIQQQIHLMRRARLSMSAILSLSWFD